MALRLKDVKGETRDLPTMEFIGGTLNIKYFPNAYTPELEEIAEKAATNVRAGDMVKRMILPVLAEWDLMDEFPVLDEDGKPELNEDGTIKMEEKVVPLDMDGLNVVPFNLLNRVLEAIGQDLTPGKVTPESLDGSFVE